MEFSADTINEAHAPSINISPGEIVDLGNALKQQIIACFEENVQAMRREHKDTESWMSSVRQEMHEATGEIRSSCQRMESDIEQCHGLLKDVMNSFCIQSKDSHIDLVNESIGRAVGLQVPEDVRAGSASTINEVHVAGSAQEILDQESKVDAETPEDPSLCHGSSQATFHSQLIEKIQTEERRREKAKRFVESHCECCRNTLLGKLVHTNAFNNICALITLAFAVVQGFDADIQVRAAMGGESIPSWLAPAVFWFNIWFVAEVSVRVFADGIHYFLDEHDWRWNIFDFYLAILSLMDIFVDTGSFGFLRLVRALKIAKGLRVVQLLGIFHGLRLLIASALSSCMSLIWSLAFLLIAMYLVAVAFLNAIASSLRKGETRAEIFQEQGFYGSLPEAMYTLLLSISGGMDWVDAANPIWHLGPGYGVTFVLYVLFCLFGILNMITSIFVENARNMQRHDPDYAVAEELRKMKNEIHATIELFESLIEDGVREITMDHLEEILRNKRVIAHFASIGIEISDTTFVAHALGDTSGGLVDSRAFVHGCLSLRGTAKQSDTLSIILHVKKVEETLEKMMQTTSRNFMLLAQQRTTLSHPSMNDRLASADLDSPNTKDACCAKISM